MQLHPFNQSLFSIKPIYLNQIPKFNVGKPFLHLISTAFLKGLEPWESVGFTGLWLGFQNCGCRFWKFFQKLTIGWLLNENCNNLGHKSHLFSKSVGAKSVLLKICECSYTHCTHASQDPALVLSSVSSARQVLTSLMFEWNAKKSLWYCWYNHYM